MRPWMAGITTMCAALLFVVTPASAAPTCGKLTGKTVVKTAKVKVVGVKSGPTTTFFGCAIPGGKVRKLGTNADGSLFSFVKSAGTFVLYRNYESPDGDGGEQYDYRRVTDLATGKTRTVWTLGLAEGECQELGRKYLGSPKAFALSAAGIVAGVYVPRGPYKDCYTPSDSTVVAVSVPGKPLQELDRAPVKSIPSTSLKLTGRTVSWTDAGQPRSATF